MAVILSVNDISFAYTTSDTAVLNSVCLQVERGTCTCLMGVNGCGKSTLIDSILNENTPQSGAITIFERDVRELSARELASLVSYVPQIHERTFPYDVRHVVMMGRTAHMGSMGRGNEADEIAVDCALKSCGIEHLADRPSTTLSGGEMQMVLLARALAQDAPLILMDEPTAHLDFRNELLFLERVAELVRDENKTVLMATHSPNQAFHLQAAGVDVRVAVMNKGGVAQMGCPEQVLLPKVLHDVYGIEAQVWNKDKMRRIVPIRTCSNNEQTLETN